MTSGGFETSVQVVIFPRLAAYRQVFLVCFQANYFPNSLKLSAFLKAVRNNNICSAAAHYQCALHKAEQNSQ